MPNIGDTSTKGELIPALNEGLKGKATHIKGVVRDEYLELESCKDSEWSHRQVD